MIEVPANIIRIDTDLVAYVNEYRGKKYVNIRKTYTDKATSQEAIGKGLTVNLDQFAKLLDQVNAITDAADTE